MRLDRQTEAIVQSCPDSEITFNTAHDMIHLKSNDIFQKPVVFTTMVHHQADPWLLGLTKSLTFSLKAEQKAFSRTESQVY